ncbi:hypothetical protein J7E49_20170 [Variovorax paradoxus]|nr:hypothetical protein [Variovorax paradoxus]
MTIDPKKLLILLISFVVAFFYFALRVIAGGGFEEAAASAAILGGLFVIVVYANELGKLSDLRKILNPNFKLWLSLLISLAVGVMATRSGKNILIITLDVFFAFFFFFAFSSIVLKFRKK